MATMLYFLYSVHLFETFLTFKMLWGFWSGQIWTQRGPNLTHKQAFYCWIWSNSNKTPSLYQLIFLMIKWFSPIALWLKMDFFILRIQNGFIGDQEGQIWPLWISRNTYNEAHKSFNNRILINSKLFDIWFRK